MGDTTRPEIGDLLRRPGVPPSEKKRSLAPARRRRLETAWAVVVLGLMLPVLALAQGEPANESSARTQAAQQFAEGSRAFDRGDFVRAADAFELAYRLVPHVDSIWNAARARQRADDFPRAATLYARYLREAPGDARDRNVASAELATLAARLGCIEVHGSGIEQLFLDEHPSEDRIIYVTPGAHVLRAVVSGSLVQETPHVAAGEVISLVLEVPAPAPAASSPVPEPLPPPEPPALETHAPPALGRGGVSPWLVAGGGVLTGVAVAATIASGLGTLSALHAFDAQPSSANLATGRSMQTRTNALLGTSIGLGVITTATAIWLVDWRGVSRSHVRLGIGVARAEAEWRF
jgi:hypothetical protein